MNNRKFYQETFSHVRSNAELRWEEMERAAPERRRTKSPGILAAVIALLAVFSTVAAANEWFGLRDLELMAEQTVPEPDGGETVVMVPTGLISLQGFGDTPEKKAAEEWQNFLSSYDDGGLLERLGNKPSGFEEEYGLYFVYSQEMADALEEILAKYGLKKHTFIIDDLYTDEALCDQVGGDFLGENHAGSTYMYEDGTFHFDGEVDLAGYGTLDYQFMRCVRGSFTDVMLNIGQVEDYTEWTHITACGIPVTLALAPHKALVLADLPDSFVTINVLAGKGYADVPFSSGAITAGNLENFADTFDFSLLMPVKTPDPSLPRPSLDDVLGRPSPDAFLEMTGMEETEAQAFFAEWVRLLEAGDRMAAAEKVFYPADVTVDRETVTVQDAGELLIYYDLLFTEGLLENIRINQYDQERFDLLSGSGAVGAAGGMIWFAGGEGDRIGIIGLQNPEGQTLRQTG